MRPDPLVHPPPPVPARQHNGGQIVLENFESVQQEPERHLFFVLIGELSDRYTRVFQNEINSPLSGT